MVIEDPSKSRLAGNVGYQRWPQGPAGKRVSSIWNWAMPINRQLPVRRKRATWLYMQRLASRPTQMMSAIFMESPDAAVRTEVNRLSIWNDPEYRQKETEGG